MRAISPDEEFRLQNVCVVGSGSWGTAVTTLLAPRCEHIEIWSHEQRVADGINATRHNPAQLPDYEFPPQVHATSSLEEAVHEADAVLLVVPSAFLRATCAALAPYLGAGVPVLVLTKGVERESGCLMADVTSQELGHAERVAVLSGPNHAEEISNGTISAAVVAAQDEKVGTFFQRLLVCPAFRVYVTSDVRGVEVCAAVKNVMAIACGIAYALGAGDNTLAALMTRGLAEMSRIASSLGADPLTCMGLAGMGDLIVTCTSKHSRNRTFGQAFVSGESLADYQARTSMVVEGAEAAASVLQLAREKNVQVPITQVVYDLLYCEMPLSEAIDALLGRQPTEEFYGMARK